MSRVFCRLFHDRLPVPRAASLTGLAVTDPLVLYKAYVASGTLNRDQQQLRCAIELQKLYLRVKDYEPEALTGLRLRHVAALIRRNRPKNTRPNNERSTQSLSLSRSLVHQQDPDDFKNIDAPLGLLVNGHVGSGKTMLVDLFATCLPHACKARYHTQHFVLSIFRQIHEINLRRRSLEDDFVLLEVAARLVRDSSVLVLDEFALPDIAAAKVVQTVLAHFFRLGGVLVATSNRLPEELYSTSFNRAQTLDFGRILKLRCLRFDMDSSTDHRQLLKEDSKISGFEPSLITRGEPDHETKWKREISRLGLDPKTNTGSSHRLVVYGRDVAPRNHRDGAVLYDFEEICSETHGPADYISLASKFQTFAIDGVPILTHTRRDDARRFITLVDALYEARCQIVLRTDTDLNKLFFPDAPQKATVLEEEMYARTQISLANPYRANTAPYAETGPGFLVSKDAGVRQNIDFSKISRFTGQDEVFAYRRAVSRLLEMTHSQAWRDGGKERWIQLSEEATPWETPSDPLEKLQIEMEGVDCEEPHSFSAVHLWAAGATARLREIAKRWNY
ncbi:unnamed protein product [Kuraishia capsulata CBS 1993]|uniref:AAA+ ATPase domain-containing protein n=1 Tax=Kuraishia capsulata CBS 1993 TaxID=1382522 RepID=W6MRB3_9ASCO|nr:uncharacterized protein KUCA_T00000347001 [Kuraishia capsulata CBS 1993]CDK24385.1 unnamed protein product [Kuraishia capsulata CBS 1993]